MKIDEKKSFFSSFLISIIKLARFKTSLLIGLTTMCGYILQIAEYKFHSVDMAILLANLGAGFFLMASMNTLNDIVDVEIDKIVKPERVMPRGVVGQRTAIFAAVGEMIIGVILLLYLGFLPFILGMIVAVLGILYSLVLQKYPFMKNTLVAFSISMALLVGALSVAEKLSFKIVIIFLASFIAFTAFELHKDIGDVLGDQQAGKKTVPVILGERNAFRMAFLLYTMAFLVLTVGLIIMSENPFLVVVYAGIGGSGLLLISPSLRNVHFFDIQRQRIIMMTTFAVILLILLLSAFSSIIIL